MGDELKCDLKSASYGSAPLDVQGLETKRQEVNQATDNVQGDCFITLSALTLTTAPLKEGGIEPLIKAMKGWHQVDQLAETGYTKDLEGRYLLFSNHAAWRVREYFQKNPKELAARKDKVEIEKYLQDLNPKQPTAQKKAVAPIDPAILKRKLKMETLPGSLPGFGINMLLIEGQLVGTFIKGDPKKGARATMRIKVGDGVPHTSIEKEFGNRLQFQAPASMVTLGNKGLEMMVDQGKIVNWTFDPNRLHGYLIIYPDGTLHIADKRKIQLSELTRSPKDKTIFDLNNPYDFERFLKAVQENKLTMVGSMFFENQDGDNYTKATSPADSRRYILEFADGTFGMFDSEQDMSINDSLSIIWTLPGVKRALYCDTGYFEFARYYFYDHETRNPVDLGIRDQDKSSNRIIFFQGGKNE